MPYKDLQKRREYDLAWKTAHPEGTIAWRRNNPEKVKASYKKYVNNNKAIFYMYNLITRLANPERYRAYCRKADQKRSGSPSRIATMAATKARRRSQESTSLLKKVEIERIKSIYGRMKTLRQWFDVAVDHIIPLAKGGVHHPDNLQIIYSRENMRKSASLTYRPAIIFS